MEQHSLERHISDTHGQERQPTRLGLVTRHYTAVCLYQSLRSRHSILQLDDDLRLKSAILVFLSTCNLVLPTALLSRQRCKVPSATTNRRYALCRCTGAKCMCRSAHAPHGVGLHMAKRIIRNPAAFTC